MKEMTSAFTPEKRFESLKAAILCGLTTAIVAASLLWLHRVQQVGETIAWVSLIQGLSAMTFWASTAIAGVSGSLFGLTYRYAIRQDSNPQLKVGVVLAFGLVRGLALVDVASALAQGWPYAASLSESLLLFAIAAALLEWAMRQGWVKPFGVDA